MGLVPGDLFLELIDQPFQGLHRGFAKLFVPARLARQRIVALFEEPQLDPCVGQLAFALEYQISTSTIPLIPP